MIETKVIELLSNGTKAIGKVVLKDGLYFAQKQSTDYVVLHETANGWRALADGELANNKTVILLSDVLDLKSQVNRTIAVTPDFLSWKVKTNFVFRVKEGRSILELETFTGQEMKKLMEEEA